MKKENETKTDQFSNYSLSNYNYPLEYYTGYYGDNTGKWHKTWRWDIYKTTNNRIVFHDFIFYDKIPWC